MDDHAQLYFPYRRKQVAAAAKEKWPGNTVPHFKPGSSEEKDLEDLVEKLTVKHSIEKLGFGADAIRQHIRDTLYERRRLIKKGKDYENVSDIRLCSIIFHFSA